MAFTAPLLLAGLAAIAIPVVLHLMARDVPKTIHFPTLRFITRDKLETHSKRGVRDLLLLLIRCLIIAGIVLAFAGPFLETTPVEGATQKETVVLIDVSASMNRPGALEGVAKQLAELLEDDESLALVISGSSSLAKFPFSDKDTFLKQLQDVKFTTEEGRHEGALNDALSLFNKESKEKKLILVSDFQQHDWSFTQVPEINEEIDIKFINPFDGPRENVSVIVDRVKRMNEGRLVQIQAKIQNYGSTQKSVEVTFTAGQKVVTETIELKGSELRRLVMTMENPSASKAKVEISSDDFPFDDVYHIWVGEEAPIVVLFPERGEDDSLDHIFIQKALQEVNAGDASFRVSSLESELFSSTELESAQVLILTDRALTLPADEYANIKKFVEEGGLVIAAPQEKAGVIFSRLKTYGLADVTFTQKVSRKSRSDLPFKFNYKKENTPLLELFTNTPDSDLQNFSIYQYNLYKCGGLAENILGIDENIPGWTINSLGKGNVIISSIPFNHVWSDFTLSNTFLPLLRHTIISLVGKGENAVLYLNTGEKKVKPGEFVVNDSSYIETQEPGCKVVNETPVVINVSRLESQHTTVNLIDMKNRLKSSSGERVTVINETKAGNSFWHIFILLALAALFIEFALADLFKKKEA